MKNGLHAGLLYWFEFPHETNAFVSVGDAVGAGSEADGASVMAGVAHFLLHFLLQIFEHLFRFLKLAHLFDVHLLTHEATVH